MRSLVLCWMLLLPFAARADDGRVPAPRVGVWGWNAASLPAPGIVAARAGVWQDAERRGVVEAEPEAVETGFTRSASVALRRTAPPFVAGGDSLPDGMPLLGRALWGRNGLVRVLGLAPSSRRAELRLRRRMLGLHQKLALVTLGAFTTQVVIGEMVANNPAKHYENLQPVHRTLGYTTFGLYSASASLSIFAPPGRRYTPGFDTLDLHRSLAVVHFTGMMLMPWLGRRLADGGPDYDRHLGQHRWVGRITYGAYLGAFATILFAR